jgi:uncharacterized membrane protein YphA (DoxX/SURF4 family)
LIPSLVAPNHLLQRLVVIHDSIFVETNGILFLQQQNLTIMNTNLKKFLFGTSLQSNKMTHIVWLLFRIHIGLSMAIHAGFPKMMNGVAPEWFVKQVNDLGFTFISPTFWATMASWGEFLGGILIAIGLLTRFAALQLAFQFFVISFLWYDAPEPVTGMYFQQLYMWCYILVSVVGGGNYALDTLLMKKISVKVSLVKKVVVAVAVLLLTVNVSAQSRPLKGSGKVVTQKLNYTNFDKVELNDLDGDVNITVGKTFSISISIDDNLENLLATKENNGVLIVSLTNNKNNSRYIENTNIKINITMPTITALEQNGNNNVIVNAIMGKYFKLKSMGNGNVTITGTIDEMDIVKSGNGTIKSKTTTAKKINVTKTGNGNVEINTDSTFEVSKTGNGDIINYGKGKAIITGKYSGNGEIVYKQKLNQ